MGNIFKIKRGNTVPTTDDLAPYELGYNTKKEALHINNGSEEIISFGSKVYIGIIITLTSSTTEIKISGLELTDNCSVFIDVYATDSDMIKVFRKADLIHYSSSISAGIITLKPNGILPNNSTTIPLKITVVY